MTNLTFLFLNSFAKALIKVSKPFSPSKKAILKNVNSLVSLLIFLMSNSDKSTKFPITFISFLSLNSSISFLSPFPTAIILSALL